MDQVQSQATVNVQALIDKTRPQDPKVIAALVSSEVTHPKL